MSSAVVTDRCALLRLDSILQPELSEKLRERKLAALAAGDPGAIATANIGCLVHPQAATRTPVRHWIQLLDEASGPAQNSTP